MLFRTIVSAFFLSLANRDDLATLVRRAGMTDPREFDEEDRIILGFFDPDRHVVGGAWGAFQETWAIVDESEGLRVLQLYSPATRYYDASGGARRRAESGEDDAADSDEWPLSGYVRTFRDACTGLAPRAAIFDSRQHFEDEAWVARQGSRDSVLELAPLVAGCEADTLAGLYFSLLYLDAEMRACVKSELLRDTVETPRGCLIFARGGPTRMS